MNRSETIGKLAAALSKCQGELGAALKDTDNPFFKSKYADLASVWAALKEPLTSNGLAVSQVSRVDAAILTMQPGVIMETVLMHSSGEWISGEAWAPLTGKMDAQNVGSVTTYLRRYGLAAITGTVQDDDDGNAAAGHGKAPAAKAAVRLTDKGAGAVADNTPAHTGASPPAPKTADDEIFGKGAAAEHRVELETICRELNKLTENDAEKWTPKRLVLYSQDGFDKPLNQLDETEANVMVSDLTETLKERRALMAENEPAVTAAPSGSLASKNQVNTLRKLLDIKGMDEAAFLKQANPSGEIVKFEQLTEEQAKETIKAVQKL